jgi:nitroreductase
MLPDELFTELVEAASLAPSADNMQPWKFRKRDNSIEVFWATERVLPADVAFMFSWVSIGAAIQNIVTEAGGKGLKASVRYKPSCSDDRLAAVIDFEPGSAGQGKKLSKYIKLRNTNRNPFDTTSLEPSLMEILSGSMAGFDANIHWTTSAADFKLMASMDAKSSYIRLEHKPLHDELFDILRFTKKDVENKRFGLTFESLGVPRFAVIFARQLQYWSVTRIVSKLGFGKMVARQLSEKLKKTGALCLITSRKRTPTGYMEAGRAMEQLWLTATSEKLSIHPYGVLPQYLTKIETEPETFLPKYIDVLEKHRAPFFSIFPDAANEFPAIILRIGKTNIAPVRSDVRLSTSQIIIDSNE